MNKFSDAEILTLLKSISTKDKGFRLLIENYQEKLYWQIRRIIKDHEDTNDVLQNVFIKVWQGIDRFKEESQLSTWLYRIAYNESINMVTQLKKMNLTDWEDSVQIVSEREDPQDDYKNEMQAAVIAGLELLPEKQKLIFKMRYFDELTYEQIAAITGTSIGGLKASYHHAIKKLETYIKASLNQN